MTIPLFTAKPKWILKGCPKCHGDLRLADIDNFNKKVYVCLQCGYVDYLSKVLPLIRSDALEFEPRKSK